jgi:hypothetical protein
LPLQLEFLCHINKKNININKKFSLSTPELRWELLKKRYDPDERKKSLLNNEILPVSLIIVEVKFQSKIGTK